MIMREFLYNTLRDLDKLAGLKQFQKLTEMEDGNIQIRDLLDKIIFIADQFKNIPEQAKQDIIYAGVVTDPNFIGLNAKVVWKWLNAEAHKYVKKVEEEPKDWKPVERGSPEYLEHLANWEKSLGQLVENFKPNDLKEQRIADKRARFFGDNIPLPPPEKKALSEHVNDVIEKSKSK